MYPIQFFMSCLLWDYLYLLQEEDFRGLIVNWSNVDVCSSSFGGSNQTFNKQCERERHAVEPLRSKLRGRAEDVGDPRDAVEQVHGAVLPVHQLYPAIIVHQAGMGPIRNKLFCHNTWKKRCQGTIWIWVWPSVKKNVRIQNDVWLIE